MTKTLWALGFCFLFIIGCSGQNDSFKEIKEIPLPAPEVLEIREYWGIKQIWCYNNHAECLYVDDNNEVQQLKTTYCKYKILVDSDYCWWKETDVQIWHWRMVDNQWKQFSRIHTEVEVHLSKLEDAFHNRRDY